MSLSDSPLCTFSSLAPSLLLEKFWVQQWQGEDKLSKPYRFTLRLATKNSLLNDESLLGERGVLTFFEELAAPHTYHGVVTEVAYLDSDAIYHYYQVILEPRVTKLRHFYFSEIWLDKSLPELIRDVLLLADLKVEGPGLSGAPVDAYDFDIRIPLKDIALTQAPFTCQFEESSFAFLSRLLEYFGIYYFFEQGAQGEALVFCGDRQYQPQTPSVLTYRRQDSELEVGQGLAVVRSFERKLVQQVAQIHLQDFSASKADVQLHCSASVAAASLAADAPLEQHQQLAQSAEFIGVRGVYGEHFGSTEAGQWLATRRAQAIGCRHREFHGAGRAGQVRAGYPVLLAGHPRLQLNTTYHVIEVSHQGYQPLPGLGQGGEMAANVATRFVALPVDVQFRPACTTPKPWVQGLLSAIVEGDEHSDMPLLNEHGCYKVSFPFIRGSKNATRGSAWVRMATPSSGSGHGMNFPLLKGAEVLVSFLGGDPDRPVIVGSVPNSANPNRVNERNVTQSGLSTPGGHVLAMEDRPAGKMMLMSTPTGSAFSLGQGAVKGAHLRTNDHMQFASTSYQHEVPGVYKMTVTGGVPPAPIAPASPEGGLRNNFNDIQQFDDSERIETLEEELKEREENEAQEKAQRERIEAIEKELKELKENETQEKAQRERIEAIEKELKERKENEAQEKAKQEKAAEEKAEKDKKQEQEKKKNEKLIIKADPLENQWTSGKAEIDFRVIMKTSLANTELSATAGLFKGGVNLQAFTFNAALAGPKAEFSLNALNRKFDLGKKYIFKLKNESALIKLEKNNLHSLKSTMRRDQSEVYLHESNGTHTIAVGQSSITLTPMGILLKTPNVFIDSDLHVSGDVIFDKRLQVAGNTFLKDSVDVGSLLMAKSAIAEALNAPGLSAKMVLPNPKLETDQTELKLITTEMALKQTAQRTASSTSRDTLSTEIDAAIVAEEIRQKAADAKFFVPL